VDDRFTEESAGRAVDRPPSKLRHELRTPIHQILGYSELLQEEAEAAGQNGFVPDLQKIQGAARRLLELIDDLFTASGSRPAISEKAPAAGEMTGFKLRAVRDVPPSPEPLRPAPEPREDGAAVDRILVVDDNELNRDMLSRRLIRNGYEVSIAVDGQQGADMAMSQLPDLILMDMSLPVIDGWEATRRIKANDATRRIPVIALTAHAMAGDREKAIEAGCDDYDTKPVEITRLLGKIATLLATKAA